MGSEKSGKTSFLKEFDNSNSGFAFDGEARVLNSTSNISCDFVSKIMSFPFTDEQLKVKLWDSASKENAIPKKIMRRAQGFLVLIDITDPEWSI